MTVIGETTEEVFDKHLDEMYGEIDVCGWKHFASDVWKAVDPEGYRIARTQYEPSKTD